MDRQYPPQQPRPILVARDLHKVYRTREVETHALSGVSLSVEAGEFVVLSGPSGCGKSTLFSVLGLLEHQTGGELVVDGHLVHTLSEAQRARLRNAVIGLVFQSFNLIPYLTVYENIAFPLRYQRGRVRDVRAHVTALAERVGIAHRLNHFPDQLSGGQQQRVAICRTLAQQPKVILADEPTGNLDSASGDQIMDLLLDINRSGTTVCLVTHDPRYQHLGTRTVRMRDGKLL